MNENRFSRRDWLKSTSLLGLAAAGPRAGGGIGEGAEDQKAIELKPGLKQLFIDDRFFAERRDIELTVNPPVKAGQILSPETPWEKRGIGYATVLQDSDTYRMWYSSYVGLYDKQTRSTPFNLCYATSEDGIHWKRGRVNLFDWHGHKQNNVVMPGTTASVMRDPQAPPEHRYKSLGLIWSNDLWSESGSGLAGPASGLQLLTSPDGIRWKRLTKTVSPFFHDSLNHLIYDERVGKYVAYLRLSSQNAPRDSPMWFDDKVMFVDKGRKLYEADASGKVGYFDPGRAVGRIELDDPMRVPWPYREIKTKSEKPFIYRQHEAYDVVMACDENDPPHTDVQMAPVIKYPYAQDVYLALWTSYRHWGYSPNAKKLEFPGGTKKNDGIQDVQLAVSRDGIHWARPDRRPYISLGRVGGPESSLQWPVLGLLRRGDELYQYYGGAARTHGESANLPQGGLFRLVQRLDGFISADAGPRGGTFTTPPMVFSGKRLEFNLNASALGYLSVEIQDEEGKTIPGYSLAEALPIDRNRLAAPARWSSRKSVGELAGTPIRSTWPCGRVNSIRFNLRDDESHEIPAACLIAVCLSRRHFGGRADRHRLTARIVRGPAFDRAS